MSGWITLSVVKGPFKGEVYHFDGRTLCSVGRAADCFLRFPSDGSHRAVSRHHCLFDIDPPHAAVRDLGSRNGTFVNGANIGQRPDPEMRGEAVLLDLPRRDLAEGDEVRIGDTVFRVHVEPAEPPSTERPAAEMETHGGVESALVVGARN